jgi:hypothetical protein
MSNAYLHLYFHDRDRMDLLVSHAQALLGELTTVLEGVTANTGQCWLLHL